MPVYKIILRTSMKMYPNEITDVYYTPYAGTRVEFPHHNLPTRLSPWDAPEKSIKQTKNGDYEIAGGYIHCYPSINEALDALIYIENQWCKDLIKNYKGDKISDFPHAVRIWSGYIPRGKEYFEGVENWRGYPLKSIATEEAIMEEDLTQDRVVNWSERVRKYERDEKFAAIHHLDEYKAGIEG